MMKTVRFKPSTIFYYKPEETPTTVRRDEFVHFEQVNYLNLFVENEESIKIPRFHRSLDALNLSICENDCKCKNCSNYFPQIKRSLTIIFNKDNKTH
jgi:hypothetical protein